MRFLHFPSVSGDVSFLEGESPENKGAGVRIPIEEVIYSGGKRIESVNCIHRKFYFNSPDVIKGKEKLYKLLSVEERELVETVKNSNGLSNPRIISRSGVSTDFYWQGIAVLYLLGIIDFSSDIKDKPSGEDIIGLVRLKKNLEKGNEDIFSILGVEKDESITGIQRAYINLVKKYDPERFGADISPEIRKSAEYVIQKLESAFRNLKEFHTGSLDNEGESNSRIQDKPAELFKPSEYYLNRNRKNLLNMRNIMTNSKREKSYIFQISLMRHLSI